MVIMGVSIKITLVFRPTLNVLPEKKHVIFMSYDKHVRYHIFTNESVCSLNKQLIAPRLIKRIWTRYFVRYFAV